MMRALRTMLLAAAMFALPAASGGFVPGHEVDIQYGPGGPGPGRDHMSWTVVVQRLDDAKASYYWAVMVYFQHAPKGSGAYAGLQPNGNRIGGGLAPLVLFSGFGPNISQVSGDCERGADGGSGLSCRSPYAWSVGRAYRFDIALISRDGVDETWGGTVTDTLARRVTTIARWKVPSAWGLLSETSIVFAEYYNAVTSCDTQPYARVLLGAPIMSLNGAAFPPAAAEAPDLSSQCNAHVRAIRTGNGYRIDTGVPR